MAIVHVTSRPHDPALRFSCVNLGDLFDIGGSLFMRVYEVNPVGPSFVNAVCLRVRDGEDRWMTAGAYQFEDGEEVSRILNDVALEELNPHVAAVGKGLRNLQQKIEDTGFDTTNIERVLEQQAVNDENLGKPEDE